MTFGGESVTSSGLATEFLIGYAPTDRLLIYYENNLQLTGDLAYDFLGLTGGGVTYLFNPRASSWYVRGAVGGAVGAEVDLDRGAFSSVERGLAFSFGGGYEFARHWLLGGSVMMLKLDDVTHRAYRGTITWGVLLTVVVALRRGERLKREREHTRAGPSSISRLRVSRGMPL